MNNFKVTETGMKGLLIIEPKVFGDHRGFFMETYVKNSFEQLGIHHDFVQDNHSKSSIGVLRGLHLQKKFPQAKLIRVLKGSIIDMVVDLRKDSDTFLQSYSIRLDDRDKRMFLVPEGFAHGFLTLDDETEISYKCTDYYHPEDEYTLNFGDENLGLELPESIETYILSDKDRKGLSLTEILEIIED